MRLHVDKEADALYLRLDFNGNNQVVSIATMVPEELLKNPVRTKNRD
jgi:hypothetical protein